MNSYTRVNLVIIFLQILKLSSAASRVYPTVLKDYNVLKELNSRYQAAIIFSFPYSSEKSEEKNP